MLGQVAADTFGALLRKFLIIEFGADAVGVAFNGKPQRRIRKHNPRYFGQLLACQRAKRVFAGVKENVRHVDHQAARGITRFQDQVELLQEVGAKLLAVTYGLLKLRIGGCSGGAIPVGVGFGNMLLLLSVVAVSFRVGLGSCGLLQLCIG